MSRPRKPYGPNPPGRLAATMVKVLSAELSDSGRLTRGKRYWADDAVVDIVIGHGAVTAEVQGSRAEPYVVTIEADGGAGVPSKREIWVHCTCPDDSGTGDAACKHAVAAMFALSDEIAIEPEVIDRWRASRRRPLHHDTNVTELPRSSDPDDTDENDRSAQIIQLRPHTQPTIEPRPEPVSDPAIDEISRLLAAPFGATTPELPEPELLEHPPLPGGRLGDVLADALDHLMIRWE
jgi:uncharacterized Zn finger protein